MREECPKLFSSYRLARLQIKNRFMRFARVLSMATDEGMVMEDLLNTYRKAAEGGVGLCRTGASAVNPEGRITLHPIGPWGDEHVPGLKKLADRAHAHGSGCVIGAQLC